MLITRLCQKKQGHAQPGATLSEKAGFAPGADLPETIQWGRPPAIINSGLASQLKHITLDHQHFFPGHFMHGVLNAAHTKA